MPSLISSGCLAAQLLPCTNAECKAGRPCRQGAAGVIYTHGSFTPVSQAFALSRDSIDCAVTVQDPGNYREALREAMADEAEGADIMMVKPGLPYLDIIRLLRDNTALPIAAYHVSGGALTTNCHGMLCYCDLEACIY